ncbi:MAG: GCN5-related N-acetyltransferase [Marmoricola sp.]|nr:GCN5-related N-acetyltransferase [Marmoricola sp.]
MTYLLEFHPSPTDFLAAAGDLLAARPVESTVVASVAGRMMRDGTGGIPAEAGIASWWLVVRDQAGEVVGAAMRTAPFPPFPPYLLAMPIEAARDLALVLHGRSEPVSTVNGAVPAVQVFADTYAAATGGMVRRAEQMRLEELGQLVPPARPAGRLRVAVAEDQDLVHRWFVAFSVDAAAQAGRHDPHPPPIETHDSVGHRIDAGDIWIWEDEDGAPVHVTGYNPTSFGVARVGPVYTPAEHRGHGYAAAAVAEISRRLLDEGARVCLFTDSENATSNGVYERLGYRPLVDMANLVIESG